eukprot:917564-Amphidinium_carterae.1
MARRGTTPESDPEYWFWMPLTVKNTFIEVLHMHLIASPLPSSSKALKLQDLPISVRGALPTHGGQCCRAQGCDINTYCICGTSHGSSLADEDRVSHTKPYNLSQSRQKPKTPPSTNLFLFVSRPLGSVKEVVEHVSNQFK